MARKGKMSRDQEKAMFASKNQGRKIRKRRKVKLRKGYAKVRIHRKSYDDEYDKNVKLKQQTLKGKRMDASRSSDLLRVGGDPEKTAHVGDSDFESEVAETYAVLRHQEGLSHREAINQISEDFNLNIAFDEKTKKITEVKISKASEITDKQLALMYQMEKAQEPKIEIEETYPFKEMTKREQKLLEKIEKTELRNLRTWEIELGIFDVKDRITQIDKELARINTLVRENHNSEFENLSSDAKKYEDRLLNERKDLTQHSSKLYNKLSHRESIQDELNKEDKNSYYAFKRIIKSFKGSKDVGLGVNDIDYYSNEGDMKVKVKISDYANKKDYIKHSFLVGKIRKAEVKPNGSFKYGKVLANEKGNYNKTNLRSGEFYALYKNKDDKTPHSFIMPIRYSYQTQGTNDRFHLSYAKMDRQAVKYLITGKN